MIGKQIVLKMLDCFTFKILERSLNLAIDPYEPNLSAAITTPSLNLIPKTEVPVTDGYLKKKMKFCKF